MPNSTYKKMRAVKERPDWPSAVDVLPGQDDQFERSGIPEPRRVVESRLKRCAKGTREISLSAPSDLSPNYWFHRLHSSLKDQGILYEARRLCECAS
jgi:hypothetical protein